MKRWDRIRGGGVCGAVLRFILAALFGSLVSIVLVMGVVLFGVESFWDGRTPHILWIIPAVWGVLGVFWFGKMLDFAREVFEGFFRIGD